MLLGGAAAVVGSDSREAGREPPSTEARPPESSQGPSFVRSGSTNIYAVDLATRSLDQLTKNDGQQIASGPAWSEAGQIVFSQEPSGDEQARLFLVNPDGSERKQVRTRARDLFGPTWAPDGRRLAVQRLGSGIYVMDLRTRSMRKLSATDEFDDAPAWSPDGKTIAFQRQVVATNLDIYRIDANGGGLRRLTRDPQQQINPAWSPDGSRLAFSEQHRDGNWVISSMKLDGSDHKVVTDPRRGSQNPAWSPDGEQIAFVLQESTRDSIAVVAADGGRPVRITPRHLVAATSPAWSPDGRKIVFAAHHAVRPPPGSGPGAGQVR